VIGRDDLSASAELEEIAVALPEHRHFIWRLKAALASRHELERLRKDVLRQLRRFYPGATVSGAAKLIEQDWARYLMAGFSRDEAAGRPPDGSSMRREALWRVSVLTNGQALTWRSIVTIFEAGEPGEV
jgi:hypothetical protein